jgi:uncharacterized protein (TIGR00661 family)
MKVLIAPMAAAAETAGPFSRAAALCHALLAAGHEVAFCAAEDGNYHKIESIKNYEAPVPSPLGLPPFLTNKMLKIVQKLNVQEKKEIHSFEQVLHFVGATDKSFFADDVLCIRSAIRDFKPDVVYSEFRPAAIVAAKAEQVCIAAGYSYPVQPTFASDPKFSKGVRDYLENNHLPAVQSVLEIFEWADVRIVPSSYELEPIAGKNVVFVGPFQMLQKTPANLEKNKIIAYMGSGSITQNTMINELTKAFENTRYQVFIAAKQTEPYQKGNITVDRKFDFSSLMPQAAAYINHGGQNSIMTALMYGVPQIICAGKNFERKYNADSIVQLQAGVSLSIKEFTAENIAAATRRFEESSIYAANAEHAGDTLRKLGGAKTVVQVLETLIKNNLASEKEH